MEASFNPRFSPDKQGNFSGEKVSPGVLPLLLVTLLLSFTSCDQEPVERLSLSPHTTHATSANLDSRINVLNSYTSVSGSAAWELQQARAATARYRDIRNAIKDEYVDIAVVVENMGYHYMKMSNVDSKFDFRQPEILVYNRKHDGSYELLAVEYAIPLELSANAPEGFSGDADQWDENHGFGLWLLHAWVWSYNPDGVFSATNSLVHLH
jgi:hypothetical protein